MKLRLSILLLAAALAASPAAGQTIKSLGFNTTNGQVVANTGTNVLTFTNNVYIGGSVRILDGTNKAFEFPNDAEAEFSYAISFLNTNAAAATLTNLGLGATNAVTFGTLTAEQLQVKVGTNLYVGLADDVSEFWTDVAVNGELSVNDLATFSTNVTVNGNATLNGVGNIAPAQTADSGSSLMTRDLGDARYSFSRWYTGYELLSLDSTTGGVKSLNSGNGGGGIFDNWMVAIPDANTKFNLPVDWRISGQVKIVSYWTDRGATNSGGTNADIAVWSTPFARSATNNSALPLGVNGTQVQTVFTANYGGAPRAYVVEQTMDFSTVSGINATNPLQVKFVELQRRTADATDTSTNTIWLSGVHIYVP
jgi:hypothetical protein